MYGERILLDARNPRCVNTKYFDHVGHKALPVGKYSVGGVDTGLLIYVPQLSLPSFPEE